MAIDLKHLVSKFKANEDVETPEALFLTKVPSVAPEAYLHTIYKPAPSALVQEVAAELRLPCPVVNFYKHWNGARLFFAELSILGCVPKGALIDRTDRFKLPPFNIRDAHYELRHELSGDDLVAVGGYAFDGSLVCIHRQTKEIICFVGESTRKERMRWESFETWVTSEVQRISILFDENGNRLVGEEHLLPNLVRKQ